MELTIEFMFLKISQYQHLGIKLYQKTGASWKNAVRYYDNVIPAPSDLLEYENEFPSMKKTQQKSDILDPKHAEQGFMIGKYEDPLCYAAVPIAG